MKKLIVCLLSTVMLALSLSACSESKPEGKYTIQLCGFSDSIPEAVNQLEYDKWSYEFTDDSVEQNITVSLNGRTVEMEYAYSIYRTGDYYPTHAYRAEDFSRYSVTNDGELNGFICYCNQEKVKDSDTIYTEEECRDIATTFLSRYTDVENYSVETRYYAEDRRYSFFFKKFINEIESADEAEIRIAENGHIFYMAAFMLNKIPTDAQFDFDFEEIEGQITARLDEMYAEAKEVYDRVEYDLERYTLTMDENGEYMLVCDVVVGCYTDSGNGYSRRGSRHSFVIWEN